MLSQTKPDPEILKKFTAGKALLKSNPAILDEKIAALAPAAQAPARKFVELMLKEDTDMDKFLAGGNAIKAGLPTAVTKELDGFKFDFAEVLGLW